MRKIEILIVVLILFALAALVGCKDEAEASEHIEGKIVWLDKLYIFDGHDYIPTKSDRPEPDEEELFKCFERLLVQVDICLGRIEELEKSKQPMNSFVSLILSEDIEVNGEKQCDMTADERLDLVRRAFKMMVEQEKEYDPNCLFSRYEIYSVHIEGLPEPNEPEEHFDWDTAEEWIESSKKPDDPEATRSWIHIADPNEPQKVSLDFIPTWPDYIELEKELIIGHTKFVNPSGSIGDHYGIVLEKGTKIYFKE